jgi:hypothetical protein
LKIRDNFSENHLLFNKPVHFTIFKDDEQTIVLADFFINLISTEQLYFNEFVATFINMMRKTAGELKEQFKINSPDTTHLLALEYLFIIKDKFPSAVNLTHNLICGIQSLCAEVKVKEGQLYIQDVLVTDELFERFRNIWLMSAGLQNYNQMYKYMSPEQRALEERIQAIKNKGRKQDGGDNSFEKSYMVLTYEFGYTAEQILAMTPYMIKTILKYTSRSINYKLTLAAKANGNTKKVKFITDKGD